MHYVQKACNDVWMRSYAHVTLRYYATCITVTLPCTWTVRCACVDRNSDKRCVQTVGCFLEREFTHGGDPADSRDKLRARRHIKTLPGHSPDWHDILLILAEVYRCLRGTGFQNLRASKHSNLTCDSAQRKHDSARVQRNRAKKCGASKLLRAAIRVKKASQISCRRMKLNFRPWRDEGWDSGYGCNNNLAYSRVLVYLEY